MSDEKRDAQLEHWIGEFEYFERHPLPRISGMKSRYGRGQKAIDLRVTDWLRREANALHFRRMFYGST